MAALDESPEWCWRPRLWWWCRVMNSNGMGGALNLTYSLVVVAVAMNGDDQPRSPFAGSVVVRGQKE